DAAGQLYALIHAHCLCAALVSADSPARLLGRIDPDRIVEQGLDDEEAALPVLNRSPPAVRLLREFFDFPARFGFFKITGLAPLFAPHDSDVVELVLFFDQAAPAL